MYLIEIVQELRKARGSKLKTAILEKHKDNEMWKKFLKYTYDPRISYGVSAPHCFDFDPVEIDENMFIEFDELAARKITGNLAKSLTKVMSKAYGEISRLVLLRSIKAGVSFGLIKKVYPGLIVLFESMKGRDVPIKEYPVWTSIKFDGCKVFCRVAQGVPTLMTSSGLEFKLKSLEEEFSEGACDGMYEGELTHKEGKMIHRPIITGHLNSLLAGTKDDLTDYKFQMYDWVPMQEWDSQRGELSWTDRQIVLRSQMNMVFQDSAYVTMVEQHLITNEEQLEEIFEHLIVDGYEGTMSRYGEDTYVWKRVEHLIKKKAIRECVLICVGTIPHSNPAKGITGSLVLEGRINDKTAGIVFVKVKTGSGLSKFDIQCEAERYIGEEIEVLYNSVTTVDGKHSLFLPRYKRIAK